jgi:hypothetical protein
MQATLAVEWALSLSKLLNSAKWSALLDTLEATKLVMEDGHVLRRGVRAKVGICADQPTNVALHTATGRADYFGPFVNRCARLLACAASGQIIVLEEQMMDVLHCWRSGSGNRAPVAGATAGHSPTKMRSGQQTVEQSPWLLAGQHPRQSSRTWHTRVGPVFAWHDRDDTGAKSRLGQALSRQLLYSRRGGASGPGASAPTHTSDSSERTSLVPRYRQLISQLTRTLTGHSSRAVLTETTSGPLDSQTSGAEKLLDGQRASRTPRSSFDTPATQLSAGTPGTATPVSSYSMVQSSSGVPGIRKSIDGVRFAVHGMPVDASSRPSRLSQGSLGAPAIQKGCMPKLGYAGNLSDIDRYTSAESTYLEPVASSALGPPGSPPDVHQSASGSTLDIANPQLGGASDFVENPRKAGEAHSLRDEACVSIRESPGASDHSDAARSSSGSELMKLPAACEAIQGQLMASSGLLMARRTHAHTSSSLSSTSIRLALRSHKLQFEESRLPAAPSQMPRPVAEGSSKTPETSDASDSSCERLGRGLLIDIPDDHGNEQLIDVFTCGSGPPIRVRPAPSC